MSKLFRPGPNARPDTVVVSYYPLAGNDANTGPRYQQEAELADMDIIGLVRPGADTTARHTWQRSAFSLEHFDTCWRHYMEDIDSQTKDYDYMIVRGQSTGAFPALNMIKNGLVRATHLLLEDGINLHLNRNGEYRGPVGARMDWLRGQIAESRAGSHPPQAGWQKPPFVEGTSAWESIQKFRTELYHWSPLWRTRYSRDSALEVIATQPKLPVYFAFIGHTSTATPEQVVAYCQEIEAAKAQRPVTTDQAAKVKTLLFPDGWHDWLEYPQFGAQNLQIARSMESFVS